MKVVISYKQREWDNIKAEYVEPKGKEERIYDRTIECSSEDLFKKPLSDLLMRVSINPLAFQIVAITILDSYYDY